MTDEPNGAVVAELVDIVAGVLSVPADDVPTEKTLRDGLDVQSVEMLEVVLAIESRFHVSIPDAEVGRFADRSIADIATWVGAVRR